MFTPLKNSVIDLKKCSHPLDDSIPTFFYLALIIDKCYMHHFQEIFRCLNLCKSIPECNERRFCSDSRADLTWNWPEGERWPNPGVRINPKKFLRCSRSSCQVWRERLYFDSPWTIALAHDMLFQKNLVYYKKILDGCAKILISLGPFS